MMTYPDTDGRLYLPRPGMAPPRSPVEAAAPLRVLDARIAIPSERQVALGAALSRIGPTVHAPWTGTAESGRAILAAVRAHRPDLVFAQIQSDPGDFPAALRAAVGPSCTLVLWTGDVRTSATQPVERWLARAAQAFDLVLADSLTYPRKLVLDEGATAACGYLGCGIDPDLNPWRFDAAETGGAVFLGTNYHNLDGGERLRLFSAVADALPGEFNAYGGGWNGVRWGRPFVEQAEASRIMRAAAVVISTSLFQDLERYTSDRLKRAMASGAVVAVRRFPDMEGLGLRPGENCLSWDTTADLIDQLRKWTRPWLAAARIPIRRCASSVACQRFTWDRIVEELLAIVRDHRARRGLS